MSSCWVIFTRDPELRYIPSGMAVVDIGLAINDRRKGPNGDWIEETTFVDVTLWGRTAEIAGEYLTKGSPLLIEGRLKLDTWETNDGQKRSKLKVVGERMQLLGPRGSGGARAKAPRAAPSAPARAAIRPMRECLPTTITATFRLPARPRAATISRSESSDFIA